MTVYKKKFFWWWSWHSEKFENFLEEMSNEGWVVESTTFGHTWITFKKSAPKKVRYCVDYQNKYRSDYLMIMEDDNWHLIGKQVGWSLWSKEFEDVRPSIFTDKQDLIDRNKRLLAFLSVLILIEIPFIFNSYKYFKSHSNFAMQKSYIYYIFGFIFLAYALFKIYQQNKSLKQ